MKMKNLILASAIAVSSMFTTGCSSEATTASYNMKRAAESFEVQRRAVFYNGITDTYVMEIEGKLSVETTTNGRLEVTVKTGPGIFKVHYLGISDNVTYFVEQLESVGVDEFRNRIIFRPESIIPAVDLQTR